MAGLWCRRCFRGAGSCWRLGSRDAIVCFLADLKSFLAGSCYNYLKILQIVSPRSLPFCPQLPYVDSLRDGVWDVHWLDPFCEKCLFWHYGSSGHWQPDNITSVSLHRGIRTAAIWAGWPIFCHILLKLTFHTKRIVANSQGGVFPFLKLFRFFK